MSTPRSTAARDVALEAAPISVHAAAARGFAAADLQIPTGSITLIRGPESAPHLALIKHCILDESSRRLRAALDLRQDPLSMPSSGARFDSVDGLQPGVDIRRYLQEVQRDSALGKQVSDRGREGGRGTKSEATAAGLLGLDGLLEQFLNEFGKLACYTSGCALEDASAPRVAARIVSDTAGLAPETTFAVLARRRPTSLEEIDGFLSAAVSAGVRRIIAAGDKDNSKSKDKSSPQILQRLQIDDESKESRRKRAEELFSSLAETGGDIALAVDTLSLESLNESRLLESFAAATALGAQIVSLVQLDKNKAVCREWRSMPGYLCSSCGAAVQLKRGVVLGGGPETIALRYSVAEGSNNSERLLSEENLLNLSPEALRAALPQEASHRLFDVLDTLKDLLPPGLMLSQKLSELSSGEGLLLMLLSFLSRGLNSTTFFIERPSDVLRSSDLPRLSALLQKLREQGNTPIILDTSLDLLPEADWVLEFAPKAELAQYELSYCASAVNYAENYAADYKDKSAAENKKGSKKGKGSKKKSPAGKQAPSAVSSSSFGVPGYTFDDDNSLEIPFGKITAICGAMGSGKTMLLNDIVVAREGSAKGGGNTRGNKSRGAKTFFIEEEPAVTKRSPKSKPADMLLDRLAFARPLAEAYAQQAEARKLGLEQDDFLLSNVDARCPGCNGRGTLRVELDFVGMLEEECQHCAGARFSPRPRAVQYKGRSIAEILALSIYEANAHFAEHPVLAPMLLRFASLGLGELLLSSEAAMLSRFQQKRAAFAAVLLREYSPGDVLCLDQTLSGASEEVLSRAMSELRRCAEEGAAVVIATHDSGLLAALSGAGDQIIEVYWQKKLKNLELSPA